MPFRSIVVGTDGSDTAHAAVRQAIDLANEGLTRLIVVSAYRPLAGDQVAADAVSMPGDGSWTVGSAADVNNLLDEVAAEAREAGVAQVATYARQGDAADAILDVAEETGSDLIVVGNKGMTGARRFLLGSVPNKVSHHAPCSVLIVRTS